MRRLLKKYCEDICEMIVRRRFTLPPELRHTSKLSDALQQIDKRWPQCGVPTDDPERPIFIFSAGWRSGSTLMQRLVVSSGEVAIWGEPLADAAMIPRLGHSISTITGNWPSDTFFSLVGDLSELSGRWIANLTPEIRFLRSALKAMVQEWLGTPAKEKFSVERWGLKETRLTIDHARYLKWLFPNARFIFIYRNPFHAYRSWKGNRWRSSWPGYYTKSPVAFARHWSFLLKGFLDGYREVDGMIVKFEDLIEGKVNLCEIANHLEVKDIDSGILNKKVGGPGAEVTKEKKRISPYDRMVLLLICNSLLKKLGYR